MWSQSGVFHGSLTSNPINALIGTVSVILFINWSCVVLCERGIVKASRDKEFVARSELKHTERFPRRRRRAQRRHFAESSLTHKSV